MSKTEYYRSVVRSEPLIFRYFTRRSRDPEEISDLAQETMAALLDAYRSYRGEGIFSTWIYSVCRNVYRKHIYYQTRSRRLDAVLKRNYAATPGENGCSEIRGIVEHLDFSDRRLYRLYYVERRSIAEIASLLGRAEGTTKWLLFRLRERVRDAILDRP